MVGVDVSGLDVDEALGVISSGAKAFAQELGNNFNKLRVQPGEPLQFLAKL